MMISAANLEWPCIAAACRRIRSTLLAKRTTGPGFSEGPRLAFLFALTSARPSPVPIPHPPRLYNSAVAAPSSQRSPGSLGFKPHAAAVPSPRARPSPPSPSLRGGSSQPPRRELLVSVVRFFRPCVPWVMNPVCCEFDCSVLGR